MADRTAEFMALARAVPQKEMSSLRADGQQQQTSGEASATRPQNRQQQQNPALAELRNFRVTASEISRDVSTTSTLLAELSRLVKTGGNRMFADEVRRERGIVGSERNHWRSIRCANSYFLSRPRTNGPMLWC